MDFDEYEERRLAKVRELLKRACTIGAVSPRLGDIMVARAANVLAGVVHRQERTAQVLPFPPRTK